MMQNQLRFTVIIALPTTVVHHTLHPSIHLSSDKNSAKV